MLRLVTVADIQANPELSKKGISVNQMHNFPDDESIHAIEPTDPPVHQIAEHKKVEATKTQPKKELSKVQATKTEVTKEVKKSVATEPKKAETKKTVVPDKAVRKNNTPRRK